MSREHGERKTTSALTRVVIVTAVVIAAGLYLAGRTRAEEVPPRESLAKLPMTLNTWMGRREPDFTPEVLAVLGVDDYITRTYARRGQMPIGLYIGYHSSQRQGDAIHSPLNCLPGAGWLPIEQGRSVIQVQSNATAAPAPVEVNRFVIAKGLDRALVFYWYQSHRRVVASEYWGKIYTVLDSVRYNRTDAALVRVVVPIPDGIDAATVEKDAITFVQSLFPLLPRYLPS
jgi:EpsI family protein